MYVCMYNTTIADTYRARPPHNDPQNIWIVRISQKQMRGLERGGVPLFT